METDYAENHDLAKVHPDILAAGAANFSAWFATIKTSIANESKCSARFADAPSATPFPSNPVALAEKCAFHRQRELVGSEVSRGHVESKEECCGACVSHPECDASDFITAYPMHPTWDGQMSGGTCRLLHVSPNAEVESASQDQIACVPL
jgi:hypothetical protein